MTSSLATARRRLAFALDYPSLAEARTGASRVREHAGVLKVGLELFVREGAPAVALGEQLGCEVFLDLKLHDIPETVERAVASACGLGARYLTLHAAGGPRMLEAAAGRAEREGTGLVLLAVTVLTSLDAADLAATGVSGSPAEQALRLARLARGAGIPGLVCSAAEVGALREALGPEPVLVTPGIRPSGASAGDQKRTGSPGGAIRAGSSLLVVGRPIRDAAEPAVAAQALVSEIAEALDDRAAR
ncbi:MAG: orotidine-5'-phosphate decarboxylase [Sorangiineae bacterium]|nr:orotidine-5'-phosphate decarboxylase [Polyangiaceae bacterium]MEB2324156.1 orotidine-5'-phosphate decarboxylase [Sorangiineae bacterium]